MRCSSNPAERLNEILLRAKDFGKKDLTVSDMWADVFEIDREDKSRILSCIANVIMLTENVKKDIEGLRKGNRDSLVRGILKLQHIFIRMDLSAKPGSFINQIDELMLNTVEGCSLVLDVAFDYKQLEQEQLDTVKVKINNIIQQVLDSVIPDEMKNFIVLRLNEIDFAIINYKISGLEGLKAAINKCAGEIFLDDTICREVNKNNEKVKVIVEKVLSILRNINTVVTFSCNTIPIMSKRITDIFLK
ncbi:hypothetical protein CLORY_34460 [Clostridium oryzae]|uniref:Uncharacterized protein n=2 Tax=Clostridium oryzae TaxID=1450648 RepID=A0A1V4IGQ9_9CLOT|nr:hypothetical protein CLORY_34460 [Clostridium oryzae]